MAARLIALLLGSLPALAGAGDIVTAAERQQWLERAATLQAEAAARQQQADALLQSRQTECTSKFLVNACLDKARAEHLTTTREVRRLESESQALEREAKQEELRERERAEQEKAPQREAELAAREAAAAAERQATEEATARRLADKERKAGEGARRKAADAEKQRQKQAEHEARVAKKKQQAEQK
jgi:hypothetical protein